MRTKFFYIGEEALLQMLRHYGKGPDSKDYEYAVSIYTKRLFEQEYNRSYTIVFEANEKYNEPDRILRLTPKQVEEVMRSRLKENTPVDFGLAPGSPGNLSGVVYPFQVKRYIGDSSTNFPSEMTNFINRKARSYAAPDTSFIVIPELSDNQRSAGTQNKRLQLPINEIMYGIQVSKKSLRAVFILSFFDSEIKLTQVWPNYAEFSYSES